MFLLDWTSLWSTFIWFFNDGKIVVATSIFFMFLCIRRNWIVNSQRLYSIPRLPACVEFINGKIFVRLVDERNILSIIVYHCNEESSFHVFFCNYRRPLYFVKKNILFLKSFLITVIKKKSNGTISVQKNTISWKLSDQNIRLTFRFVL